MAVALDVAVVLDPHRARHTDPAQIVAAEVDQHQMLGALLLIGQQVLLQQLVLFLGLAPPAGTGDRVRGGPTVHHGHQRFRAGADDRKRRLASIIGDVHQIHVRARVGHPQHPVDVDRVDGGVDLEALRRHHLEGLTSLDLLDQSLDHRPVLLRRPLEPGPRFGSGERGHRGRQRLPQRLSHHVQSGHRVVVGPVDAFVGAVPVHRVGDQGDGALVVVHGGKVGGQQQQHVGQLQIVDGQLGQPFQAADEVVGEVADHAPRQRRNPGERAGGEQRDRLLQRLQRVTPGRGTRRRVPEPHRVAVPNRQRRGRTGPDERPARP